MIRPNVLSIAGYDATAGAGVLADIKTFEMHDVYGMGVISGNTFQTDSHFSAVDWMPLETIKKQLQLLLDEYDFDYVKIGIIENIEVLKEIVYILRRYKSKIYIIWDPIIRSSSGFLFHEDHSLDIEFIESQIDLITPNWIEFDKLYPSGLSAETRHCDILLKGGHREDKEGTDILICGAKEHIIEGQPFGKKSKHGTGCVLSAAIISNLAKGETIESSCRKAKKYTEDLILSNESNLGYHHTKNPINPMEKQISRFQLITREHPKYSHSEQVEIAFRNGCKWVQLRIKNKSESFIEEEARKAMIAAKIHDGILIINDNPHIAARVGAHGVHLGKSDMKISEARSIMGCNAIIGGTSNTLEDVMNLVSEKADYIGLGPFRFTSTKENLSPIIGLEGYQNILRELSENKICTPVVAIGGIKLDDVDGLLKTGIHGIAISGAIHYSDFENSYKEFMRKLI